MRCERCGAEYTPSKLFSTIFYIGEYQKTIREMRLCRNCTKLFGGDWFDSEKELIQTANLVYPFMAGPERFVSRPLGGCDEYRISCDYGTINPCSFGLWGRQGERWYRIEEYYYDARLTGKSRTDKEHYHALCQLAGALEISAVIIDPSAASFIETVKRGKRFPVVVADYGLKDGIDYVTRALLSGRVIICDTCKNAQREFKRYHYDGAGRVVKSDDHAMDDIRYFTSYLLKHLLDRYLDPHA